MTGTPTTGRWIAALVAASLAMRLAFHSVLPHGLPFDEWAVAYLDGLREHFLPYMAYTPRKPPLFSVLHAPLAWLFDTATIERFRMLSVELWVFDAAAMALLFAVAVGLGAPRPLAFLVLVAYSACLMPLELFEISYDAHYVFFISLFLYAGLAAFRAPSARRFLLLGGGGALLVAQSTVSSLLVPAMIAVVAGIAPGLGWRAKARRLGLALVLPVAMVALLVGKNYGHSGLAATANGAGHTHILYVMLMNDWDVERTRKVLVEAGVPDWYLWCYDNPVPMDKSPGAIYARSWAHCGVRPLSGTAGYDMTELRDRMAGMGEHRLAALVQTDIDMMATRPWMAAPFGYTATHFFAEFSKVNVAVGRHVFRHHPAEWLRLAALIHNNIWTGHGPDSLGHYVRQFWPVPGVAVPAATAMRAVNRMMAQLTRRTYFAIPLLLGLLAAGTALPWLFRRLRTIPSSPSGLWLVLGGAAALDAALAAQGRMTPESLADGIRTRWQTGTLAHLAPSPATLFAAAWIIPQIALLSAIFCGTVGTENDRFFQHVVPHLAVLALVAAGVAWRGVARMAGLSAR